MLPRHPHRIDLEQKASSTAFGPNFRVKQVRLTESQVERLATIRPLMQQIAQVGSRCVSGCDRQKHSVRAYRKEHCVDASKTTAQSGIWFSTPSCFFAWPRECYADTLAR